MHIPSSPPNNKNQKNEGIKLYNQYKAAEMQLRIAAEAGDAEAQFYLAEELRKKKRYSNKEEKNGMRLQPPRAITMQCSNLQRLQEIFAPSSINVLQEAKNRVNG